MGGLGNINVAPFLFEEQHACVQLAEHSPDFCEAGVCPCDVPREDIK